MSFTQKAKSIWKIVRSKSPSPEDAVNQEPAFYASSGHNDSFLVDFREDRFFPSYNTDGNTSPVAYAIGGLQQETQQSTPKVVVKPKDVVNELETVPTNISLEGLNDKIAIIKLKKELVTQVIAQREITGLLLCLENRKKYDNKAKSGKTYREYFGKFDATNQSHIDALLKKHDLVMKSADIFIPEFPDEAVKIMAEYSEYVKELSDKKPMYFVIANKEQFRDADGKRDPILLAQSPFGFYYYVLGAWDEEMQYLPEL